MQNFGGQTGCIVGNAQMDVMFSILNTYYKFGLIT